MCKRVVILYNQILEVDGFWKMAHHGVHHFGHFLHFFASFQDIILFGAASYASFIE